METVTIVLPISRINHLNIIFNCLENLNCDHNKVNLFTYVDNDLNLFEKARNLTDASKFANRLCVFRQDNKKVDLSNVHRRRERISAIHNEVKQYIKETDYVFLYEDDTVLPSNALEILLNEYRIHPFAGFISGLQLGRWGLLHLGAWQVDDIYNPTKIESVEVPDRMEEVDAAGIYCMLTKYESYIKNEFKPYLKILGPDFDFGINLRKQGLKNYIVPNIKCGHMTPKETINVSTSDIVKVTFDLIGDRWIMSFNEKQTQNS